MANYAYLRVSTHAQDVENQKLSVLDYCNSQGIAPIEFVEDTTSGRRSWRDREIGRLLETADAGDVLVAAEVSRLARSTLQVLELLQAAADRGVTVHIAKNRMVLDQSLPATITATILGLAAQIEREFISARTKEALARRKAAGLPVGRPKGRATKLMLDDRRAEIVDYLNKGVSKRSAAKILGCSPTTLLLLDPAAPHFRKIAIHALSVHFCSIATQTPIRGRHDRDSILLGLLKHRGTGPIHAGARVSSLASCRVELPRRSHAVEVLYDLGPRSVVPTGRPRRIGGGSRLVRSWPVPPVTLPLERTVPGGCDVWRGTDLPRRREESRPVRSERRSVVAPAGELSRRAASRHGPVTLESLRWSAGRVQSVQSSSSSHPALSSRGARMRRPRSAGSLARCTRR